MRQPKLIAGQMNIPYIKCKAGYADGAARPKRVVKPKPFNPVIKLRKLEYEAA